MLYADMLGLYNVVRSMARVATNAHADPAFWLLRLRHATIERCDLVCATTTCGAPTTEAARLTSIHRARRSR